MLVLSDFSALGERGEAALAALSLHAECRLLWVADAIERSGLPAGAFRVGLPGRQWWLDGERSRSAWQSAWTAREQRLEALARRLRLPLIRLDTGDEVARTLPALLRERAVPARRPAPRCLRRDTGLAVAAGAGPRPAAAGLVAAGARLVGAGAAARRGGCRRARGGGGAAGGRRCAAGAASRCASWRGLEASAADDAALARGLQQLLRRYALARYGREAVAGLSGEAWIAFVVARGGSDWTGAVGAGLLRCAWGGTAAADRERWLAGARGFVKAEP